MWLEPHRRANLAPRRSPPRNSCADVVVCVRVATARSENDLRDEGLEALCKTGGLDGRKVLVSLRDLYLQDNRIGDKGVSALCLAGLPGKLRVVQLQDNSIGEAGARSLARAIGDGSFKPRHLNVKENRWVKGGDADEELRAAVRANYVELKIEPKPSAATVLPSAAKQMKALDIS